MNSPKTTVFDRHLIPISDALLDNPARPECIFPYLFTKGQLTLVSMSDDVDGAPFASVCAVKAASGGTLPMFGKGQRQKVNLYLGGLDPNKDADISEFQKVLVDEETDVANSNPWGDHLRIRKQGKDGSFLYLDTRIGYSRFYWRIEPRSLTIIYDLSAWLRTAELDNESACDLLTNFLRICKEREVTLIIFERSRPDANTLAAAAGTSSEVLNLVADKKAPSQTGQGFCLLRKRGGIFDTAPASCSFWLSLTDAGRLMWGMEPIEGPKLAPQELNAVQRRILLKQWKTGERTPREIAELLGKNPADYPEKPNQQQMAKMMGVSPATISRNAKESLQKFGPSDV